MNGAGSARSVTVAGFFLSQKRAFTAWSGLTARVQNVAVEERTFFEVTSDPGFRKYVTGEVFLLGDIDRERLINIDRASFNRECVDYRVIQRFLGAEIVTFKASSVQRPQRRKVAVRRAIEEYRRDLDRIRQVLAQVEIDEMPRKRRGLPSSVNGRISRKATVTLEDDLLALDADLCHVDGGSDDGYRIEIRADEEQIQIALGHQLTEPTVVVRQARYSLRFVDGAATDPPVLIKNRPREIVFNRRHPANGTARRGRNWHLSLALEIAYLLAEDRGAVEFYDRMLALVAAV